MTKNDQFDTSKWHVLPIWVYIKKLFDVLSKSINKRDDISLALINLITQEPNQQKF